jgi:hypothetical protein
LTTIGPAHIPTPFNSQKNNFNEIFLFQHSPCR